MKSALLKLKFRHSVDRFVKVASVSFGALSAMQMAGQLVTPPVENRPSGEEEIVMLQPFEVDASGDSRYRAASTLGGSRLNSNLKDVASVIDVFTSDFINDLGANDLEQVLRYANNLENDTEDTIHGQGTLNISTNTSFRYRIRGLAASRARNYFEYDFPVDTYNTERLDESRGPNSILFGFGSPGGIVNVTTKRPLLTQNRYDIGYSVGTEVDGRATIDINQVVVPDRLAIRINALHQEETGWRKYTHDDVDAIHLAVSMKPAERTVVTADFESYKNNDSVARPMTYWSHTDTWDAAGSPLINTNYGSRNNGTLNPGFDSSTIANLGNRNYWIYTEQSGQMLNWRGMSRSNRANYTAPDGTVYTSFADYREMVLNPKGIVDINTLGPSTGRELELETFFASLQHEFARNLHVELAMTGNTSDWFSRRLPASTLYADPNRYLPAGGRTSTGPAALPVENPHAGQYYFETVAQFWRTKTSTFNYRGTLSYEFELGSNLGKHRLGLLYERDDYEIQTRTLQEQLLVNGTLASTAPANAANSLYRRYYITDRSNPVNYRNADVSTPPVPLNVTLPDGTNLTSRYIQYTSAPADYTKSNIVVMPVLQSAWLNGKLHTVLGIRRDNVEFDDWGSYVPDGAGGYERSVANRSIVKYKGTTRNAGVVYHLTDWLSAFANYSTSVGVPGLKIIYAPDGAFMEPTEGVGTDFGLKFSVPGRRIEGMVTYYTASSTNETDNQNVEGWAVNGNNNILDALADNGFISQAEANSRRATGTGDTADSETEGIELSLAGELAKNWDVRFNYSYTKRSVTNVFPRVKAWANELRSYWQTWDRDNPNTPQADNILDTVQVGSSTLRDIIDNFESNLESRTISRSRVLGLRPHKANLYTTYLFSQGALQDLRLGAGVRYEAGTYAGVGSNDEILRGKDMLTLDLMAAYTRPVFGRQCTIQVNVTDALNDEAKIGPAVINPAGTWNTLIIRPPRQITCSLRVRF